MSTRSITVLTVLTCLILTVAFAATTGVIKGRITDAATGEPIVGATVLLVGTNRGATTDIDGAFRIFRVDPGTYNLRFSSVDYTTVEVANVEVKAEDTVVVNQRLSKAVTDIGKTVTVVGERKFIDPTVIGGQVSISQESIKKRPVTNVDACLKPIPGVQTTSDGVYIRGGRAGEVAYIIDGIPVGDPRCRLVPDATSVHMPPAHGGTAIVNNEAFDAMFFKHSGVNPFVDTEDDAYSTFAADVDDASYTMTRSYLERGSLPPAEAVRVEEFVNHFDYAYEPPRREAFRVWMEGAPSKFGTQGTWMLKIGIKGKEIFAENRKPANLVFVIDVSGSMAEGNRLELVKQSLNLLLDELTPNDRVGITVYGSSGRVHLRPTSIEERSSIRQAIDRLEPDGSTNAEEGIHLGYEMANRMFDRTRINRIILCSDGVANVGKTGPDQILEEIKGYADRGITLSTVGFGMGNYNDILMEKLADKGNGNYSYVDDLDAARRVFVENLTGTLQVIARDVKVQVVFEPQIVRSYRLLGYENREVADEKFRDDKEDGGELGAGHATTALYEIKLRDSRPGRQIATVYIRHKNPETNQVSEVSHAFYTDGLTSGYDDASRDFKLAVVAAEFAEILRGSYWAKGSTLADLYREASRLSESGSTEQTSELLALIEKADRLDNELSER
jgi:Ca-activated chloride channel family protein